MSGSTFGVGETSTSGKNPNPNPNPHRKQTSSPPLSPDETETDGTEASGSASGSSSGSVPGPGPVHVPVPVPVPVSRPNAFQKSSSSKSTAPLQIEEQIGCVFDEYKCHHNNFAGILYVGPLGVVFLGRFLLFEWTMVLKWDEVTKVRRTTSSLGCASAESTVIQIETRGTTTTTTTTTAEHQERRERQIYEFERFFDPHKALEDLITLHNDSILENHYEKREGEPECEGKDAQTHHTSRRSSYVSRRGLLRSSSDPTRISALFNFDDPPLVLAASVEDDDTDNENDQNAMADLRKLYPKTASNKEHPTASSSQGSFDPRRQSCVGDDNETNETIETNETNETKNAFSEDKLRIEWEKAYGDLETCPEIAVQDRELQMPTGSDLDTFFHSILSDDATFSVPRYMTEVVGDSDVEATKWVVDKSAEGTGTGTETGGVQVQTRTIEYTHPVNAPMAPPQAQARKEQSLRNFGNQNGLILETKTFVNDVPMTDCFYVRDVLRVERTKDDLWLLNIRFDVIFVKSTMFRSLITRTTNGEFQRFMGNLADFVCQHCRDFGSGMEPPSLEEDDVPVPSSPPSSLPPKPSVPVPVLTPDDTRVSVSDNGPSSIGNALWKTLSIFLLLWIAFLQTRVLNEMQSVRHELKEWNEMQSFRDELKEWKNELQLQQQQQQEQEQQRIQQQQQMQQQMPQQQLQQEAPKRQPPSSCGEILETWYSSSFFNIHSKKVQ